MKNRDAGDDAAVFYESSGAQEVFEYGNGRSWDRWSLRMGMPAHALPARLARATGPRRQKPGTVAVFQCTPSMGRELITDWGHRAGVSVFFDVDDGRGLRNQHSVTAWAWNSLEPLSLRWDEALNVGRCIAERIELELRTADGLLAPTQAVADAYAHLNPNIHVCRSSINPDDWQAVPRIDDGVYRVGFACSPSYLVDLAVIAPALRWAARQPGVEVVAIGTDPNGTEWTHEVFGAFQHDVPEFERVLAKLATITRRRQRAWSFPYRHVPWRQTPADYQRALGQLDVALCPATTAHTALRGDSRPLQHLAAGALPLISDVSTFDYWKPLLPPACVSPADWLERVRWTIENRDEAHEIAARLHDQVIEERSIRNEITTWRTALDALA